MKNNKMLKTTKYYNDILKDRYIVVDELKLIDKQYRAYIIEDKQHRIIDQKNIITKSIKQIKSLNQLNEEQNQINTNHIKNQKKKKYIIKIQELNEKKRNQYGNITSVRKLRRSLYLQEEIQLLWDIQRNIDKIGFPKIYSVLQNNQKRAIVTNIRSINLEKIIPKIKLQLTHYEYMKFCLKVLYDLLDRIESIHRAKYVHRNLRPHLISFMKDINNKDLLIIHEYQNCKKFNQYNYKKQNYHMPYKYGVKTQGKFGYQSIWTHSKINKSRRDDLESYCYIAIHLLYGGQLPWDDNYFGENQSVELDTFQKKLKIIDESIFQQNQQKIQSKIQAFLNYIQISFSNISQNNEKQKQKYKHQIPKQIKEMLIQVRKLEFQQQPNYIYLRKCLKKVMNKYKVIQTQDYFIPISINQLYPKGS